MLLLFFFSISYPAFLTAPLAWHPEPEISLRLVAFSQTAMLAWHPKPGVSLRLVAFSQTAMLAWHPKPGIFPRLVAFSQTAPLAWHPEPFFSCFWLLFLKPQCWPGNQNRDFPCTWMPYAAESYCAYSLTIPFRISTTLSIPSTVMCSYGPWKA